MAIIYASLANIRYRCGLTISEVADVALTQLENEAANEIDQVTGRKWTSGNTATEYYNGPKKDMFDNKATTLMLNNYPVQTITEFLELDSAGATVTTFAVWAGTGTQTTDYWIDASIGKITLVDDEFEPGTKNYKVAYTYGKSGVPVEISTLCEVLSSVRAIIYFLGGKYNYLQSYSIPEQTVQKGDLFDRMLKLVAELEKEAQRLYDRIGKRAKAQIVVTGGDY